MPAARGIQTADTPAAGTDERYRWVALANTTAAVFMSVLDGSIVIIAMPAIFRGIHLDPLAPGNIAYLLWMIMGYRHGLVVVFAASAALAALAAVASLLRGSRSQSLTPVRSRAFRFPGRVTNGRG